MKTMTISLTKETEELLTQIPNESRDDFANEAIKTAYLRQEARKQLDQMVTEAEASGFEEITDITQYFEGIKDEARRRNAHRL